MSAKKIVFSGLVMAIASVWFFHHKAARTIQPAKIVQPASVISETPPPVEMPAPEPKRVQTPQPEIPPATKPKIAAQGATSPANAKETIQDPVARAALSLVGADLNAEAYWLGAIFDPNLSHQEREDLMEDLNEDGLSDPKHPGPEDLPLILNRLALIEEIAPEADDFMLIHLGEAHKDLSNLLAGKSPQ